MIVSDYDRYPECRAPDPFVAAAQVLCGEQPSMRDALWGSLRMSHRKHPLDVARVTLLREVREVLGDRALPCNCLARHGHAVACVTVGYARTVEESERWLQRIRGERPQEDEAPD